MIRNARLHIKIVIIMISLFLIICGLLQMFGLIGGTQ